MTRAWLLLLLIACADPPRRPPQLPADPNAVENCRSSPLPLGGVRYVCGGSYEVLDNTLESLSMRTIEYELVKRARATGYEAKSRPTTIAGSSESLVVEYRVFEGHAMDVIALQTLDAKVRVLQCNVLWFKASRSRGPREASCARTISLLLQRPAPPGRELTAECKQATARIATLPGRPEGADGAEEVRIAMRDFAERCDAKVAACGLAAVAFVEATLCR